MLTPTSGTAGWWIRWALAACLASLGGISCSDKTVDLDAALAQVLLESRGEPRDPAHPSDVAYDFATSLPYAEIWVEKDSIDTTRLADRGHLTAGWSFPAASEPRWIWTDAEHSEIAFWIAEKAPRRLRFAVQPFLAVRTDGPLSLRITLNGTLLVEKELGPDGANLSLDLPEEAQCAGMNVLSLDADRCWRILDHVEKSQDIRRVGCLVGELSFALQDEERRRRHSERRLLLAEGIRLRAPDDAPAAVLQVSGTSLRHHLQLRPAAHLRTGIAFLAKGTAKVDAAVFRIHASLDDGTRTTLMEREARLGAPAQWFDISLDALGGAIARLELEVADAAGSAEPVVGAWLDATIHAEAAHDEEAPPALSEARARLAKVPVVLILLDACNPSFISAYGGRQGLTPNLDRLASEGTLFETAYAQASYTIASVASMLTSLYTWEHGTWIETSKLPASIPTWPERFSEAGYRTVGFALTPNGSSLFGFDRGFDSFDDLYKEVRDARDNADAEQVLEPLTRELRRSDERPLFLWLHIVEPHEPYLPPAPWAGLYSSAIPEEISGDSDTLWLIRRWQLKPTASQTQRIKAQYEENLAYVDDVVGRIRTELEEAGIFEQALVAVFSDHGEGFLDHGSKTWAGQGHGTTIYDEMSRVPLILRLPGRLVTPGARSSQLVSNVDLLPTVADLVGVDAKNMGARGETFAAALFEPTQRVREWAVLHSASLMGGERFLPHLGVRLGKWKYIHTSGDRPQLFDLDRDPKETTNLAAELPVTTGFLRQLLRQESGFDLEQGGPLEPAEQTDLDPETLERMRALGYVR